MLTKKEYTISAQTLEKVLEALFDQVTNFDLDEEETAIFFYAKEELEREITKQEIAQ